MLSRSTFDRVGRPPFEPEDSSCEVADSDALALFLHRGDAEAFEVIVRRHGPSVLRACRKILGPGPDAEDAFQATFLVLVRNAGSIRTAEALGAWLQGVARRVATKARVRAKLLRDREVTGVDVEAASIRDDHFDVELRPAIRDEVDRLPEKFRAPIELCYWRGLSNEEAAEALSCPTGTVKWRLARGREILRSRLVRSGLASLAILMFWRRPALGGALRTGKAQAPGGVGAALGVSDDLVLRTLASAILARNGLGPIAAFASRGAAGAVGRRGRGHHPRGLLILAAVASAFLAALPAVRAAWLAGTANNRAATVPGSGTGSSPASHCSGSPASPN